MSCYEPHGTVVTFIELETAVETVRPAGIPPPILAIHQDGWPCAHEDRLVKLLSETWQLRLGWMVDFPDDLL